MGWFVDRQPKGKILVMGDVTGVRPFSERNISWCINKFIKNYPTSPLYESIASRLRLSKMDEKKWMSRTRHTGWMLRSTFLTFVWPRALVVVDRQQNGVTAMARAISERLSKYLFDEPLGYLDTKLREELRKSSRACFKVRVIASLFTRPQNQRRRWRWVGNTAVWRRSFIANGATRAVTPSTKVSYTNYQCWDVLMILSRDAYLSTSSQAESVKKKLLCDGHGCHFRLNSDFAVGLLRWISFWRARVHPSV